MIEVTKPFFPPREEYFVILEEVWDRGWLTNNGPLLRELEKLLIERLGVSDLVALGNGTISLQIAFKALELTGEVITTPFSYVATTSSLAWENLVPVFADIDPNTYCIDPNRIEEKISPHTSAILATHVFGVPCDVERIQEIAAKYRLKVIYDAAHAFDVSYKGKSLLNYGDLSSMSFHATKLFHTIEGGALVGNDPELMDTIRHMRNFGHAGPAKFQSVGINGKMSEVHAAMGILNLRYIDALIERRIDQYMLYCKLLRDTGIQFQHIPVGTDYNYSYMPVVFNSEQTTLEVFNKLIENDIKPRRYFYPVLHKLPYVDDAVTPLASSIARRVICLPLYHELENGDIERVCGIIREVLKSIEVN